MNWNSTRRSFDWYSFILGVLFIIAAGIALVDPASSLMALVAIFGAVALLRGIYEVWFHDDVRRLLGRSPVWLLFMGILDIVIGAFLIFHLGIGMRLLPIFFAIWFIVDSLTGLITSGLMRSFDKRYFWVSIGLDVLGLIVGILLLLKPVVAALTLATLIGIYFFIEGVLHIMRAF
ncbi:HdeD family acid-resistance protein [Furfurilactobacillus milii]|uniref:Acid-resistance membrane protein n=1 Tax=Furfurilactobacillus milii TaxID=2888272 RepID=A0A6N9I537_9LACO|nr:DUF308 domain-containing protein [Furfurilactobacillus milii]MYV18091.1 hypothetical protein [Furfurilactobacillus milii]